MLRVELRALSKAECAVVIAVDRIGNEDGSDAEGTQTRRLWGGVVLRNRNYRQGGCRLVIFVPLAS